MQGDLKYQAVFNATHDALVIHDVAGRIVDVNERWCSMFGCTRDQAIASGGSQLAFVDSPYSQVDAHERIRRAVQEGPQLFEWPCSRMNGEFFWTEVALHAAVIADQTYVIAAVRDISERKRNEAALRSSEARFRHLFDRAADAIFLHDRQGHIVDANQTACANLGYTRDELLQMTVGDIEVGVQFTELKAYGPRLAAGETVEIAGVHRRKDGSTFPIEARVVPFELDGETLLFVSTRDVSDRRRAEAALREQDSQRRQAELEIAEWKQRYDVLSRAAGQIVYECHVDGHIVWGDAMTTILGYDTDELQGGYSQWVERVHPDERDEVVRHFDAATAAGTAFLAEYRFRHKNGEYLWIEDAGYPLFDEQGRLMRYVGIMADVSAQRRAEADRRRLEESLRHAQKLESIGRLAGGIAHDFNNLLTAISGNLTLAMLGEGTEGASADMLAEAAKAAESAANLTRQLLTFSRKQVIHPKLLCLNDTIRGLQKMLRRLLGEDVELVARLAADLGLIESDEGQLEQVLVNLAVNSRDAMPHGGRLVIETVNVNVEEKSSGHSGPLLPGQYVRLTVSDTGTGMSPEVQEHLFEPFFTTKEAGKGTGLGLAMVYGAVQQNHGQIILDSELGRGTRFHIYLPRVEAAPKTQVDVTSPELAVGVESVMVVEDEEQVRTLAVRILQRQGYRVLAYGTGEAALAALARKDLAVDMLMTDVVMPGMNGRILAERAQEVRPGLPVLFTSGYTDDVMVQHGVLDQCIAFIAKPYTVEELTRRIREVLDQAKAKSDRQ